VYVFSLFSFSSVISRGSSFARVSLISSFPISLSLIFLWFIILCNRVFVGGSSVVAVMAMIFSAVSVSSLFSVIVFIMVPQ